MVETRGYFWPFQATVWLPAPPPFGVGVTMATSRRADTAVAASGHLSQGGLETWLGASHTGSLFITSSVGSAGV